MQDAHLRLEAARVDGSSKGPVTDIEGFMSRRNALAVSMDRRVASVQGAPAAAALLGYVVLPWCDVTLWSVLPWDAGVEVSDCALLGSDAGGVVRARAWMRVELAHIDAALAYVERLPVQHGLASKAWRWRWSSAPWHCGFGPKPRALAPEWSGPARRDLWRERLAGAFVGASDRSVPVHEPAIAPGRSPPDFIGSAVDRLAQRVACHSPGMPSADGTAEAIDPSQGELAVA
jgi:hypothetical protein